MGNKRVVLFSHLRRDRMRAGLRLRDVSNRAGVSLGRLSEAERHLYKLSPEAMSRVLAVIAEASAKLLHQPATQTATAIVKLDDSSATSTVPPLRAKGSGA